jgi:hypothetical protein
MYFVKRSTASLGRQLPSSTVRANPLRRRANFYAVRIIVNIVDSILNFFIDFFGCFDEGLLYIRGGLR